MNQQDYIYFKRFQELRKTVPALSNRSAPPTRCRECPFYHPRWKYRICIFFSCPFGVRSSTLRRKPTPNDLYARKKVKQHE